MRPHAIEELLAERGVGTHVRVAAGRSGIAVGFPRDPMIHVSWAALLAIAVVWRLLRR
jgi:hypothetical protein